jgi:hypothetical protein
MRPTCVLTKVVPLVAVLLLPATLSAQEDRFHPTIAGGPTSLDGVVGDGFGTGWGPVLGVSAEIHDFAAINVEFSYRSFQLRRDLDDVITQYDARHKFSHLAFSLAAYLTRHGSRVRPYVLAGPGLYYRTFEISSYTGDGVICDPWVSMCGTYPPDQVTGSRGGWDLGVNAGVGIGVKLVETAELFIETRYHYVWGPEIDPGSAPHPSGTGTRRVNGQYTPITFGIKF